MAGRVHLRGAAGSTVLTVVTAWSIAGLACSLVSPQAGVRASPEAGAGWVPVKANLADVHGVARQLYDQVQAGEDTIPLLAGIFEGLGIPVLPIASDADAGMAMVHDGKAVIFDLQLALIAQGLSNSGLVSVSSLLDDLAEHGVQATLPPGPLTPEYLRDKMEYLAGKQPLLPEETLPALVMALGRERARRATAVEGDPVWADGFLDPLQFELLVHGILFKGLRSQANVSPSSGRAAAMALLASGPRRFAQAGAQGEGGAGFFDSLAKLLNDLNVFEYTACGAAMLYGLVYVWDVEPFKIYHFQDDEASPPPYKSTIRLGLVYANRLTQRERDILTALFGCAPPLKNSPLPDKTIAWSLDDVAAQHGRLTREDNKTDGSGLVTAEYEAIRETTPRGLRLPATRLAADPEVTATIIDLVAGHPRLEAVTRLAGGGYASYAFLKIYYYGKITLDVEGTFQVVGEDTTTTNTVLKQTFEFQENGGVLLAQADLTLTTSATLDCGSGGIIEGKGSFTGPILVNVTPGMGAEGSQLTFALAPTMSLMTPPIADSECTHGDLNVIAWADLVSLVGATFTLGGSNTTYQYTPAGATGEVTFTLHIVAP